jgi:hypothetical protein
LKGHRSSPKLNNKNRWLVIVFIAIVLASVTIAISFYYIGIVRPTASTTTPPKFKIREIYATKPGGREWFINMNDPTSDGIFHPGSQISKQADGSWQVEGRQTNSKFGNEVRMGVYTPPGEEPWKNVEITGYAKVISANSLSDDHLDWYARGGIHTPNDPCEGSALKGWLSVSGIASLVKEIWFPGGYTDQRDIVHATSDDNPILGRWIGWKVVMYNINNNNAVKMESYLDDQDNNHWKKVTSLVDDGGWYARASDEDFYSAGCGKPKDYIITNSGPVATFRSDNMIWDFTDLSIREIQPPNLA